MIEGGGIHLVKPMCI